MPDLPIVHHPHYVAPLPLGHRFPMAKFGLLYRMLLAQGIADQQQVYCPKEPPLDWLSLVHNVDSSQSYCQGTLPEKAQRRIGLPWSPELVMRTKLAVGGTILTATLALQYG
ncbi:MAG: hypothetical protein WBA10_10710, partial [Elainellaceae cyanobacterium]